MRVTSYTLDRSVSMSWRGSSKKTSHFPNIPSLTKWNAAPQPLKYLQLSSTTVNTVTCFGASKYMYTYISFDLFNRRVLTSEKGNMKASHSKRSFPSFRRCFYFYFFFQVLFLVVKTTQTFVAILLLSYKKKNLALSLAAKLINSREKGMDTCRSSCSSRLRCHRASRRTGGEDFFFEEKEKKTFNNTRK